MKDLAIIIPVFNNWTFTKNCVEKFSKISDNFHLIIVDNGSSDSTYEEMSKINRDNLTYIRNQDNLGFAGGVNCGFNFEARNFIILNNDIRFGNVDPNVWLNDYNKKINDNKNSLVSPTAGFVDPKDNFNFKYETSDFSKEINYLSGWCLGGSKETWNKLVLDGRSGPFDNVSFFLYYEDTDLGFRAKGLGINFVNIILPINHIGRQTTQKMNMNKYYHISKEIFLKKYKGKNV